MNPTATTHPALAARAAAELAALAPHLAAPGRAAWAELPTAARNLADRFARAACLAQDIAAWHPEPAVRAGHAGLAEAYRGRAACLAEAAETIAGLQARLAAQTAA